MRKPSKEELKIDEIKKYIIKRLEECLKEDKLELAFEYANILSILPIYIE